MKDDPVISRIRAVRHQISKECDHSPEKLIEYYMRLQATHDRRLAHSSESHPRRERE